MPKKTIEEIWADAIVKDPELYNVWLVENPEAWAKEVYKRREWYLRNRYINSLNRLINRDLSIYNLLDKSFTWVDNDDLSPEQEKHLANFLKRKINNKGSE